ncbi:PIG-L family deacetylase [Arthrobacter sp. NPDC058192]|uniref:PIG-L family deacetylase n=1 Tax=Arthrobacter sp. NPDC058192 TaxID=3346372 RepID=UPI0036E0B02E
MVSFSHTDVGTSEDAWAASGVRELPQLPLDATELAGSTFIILAAHPDDETLGAGGLMARVEALGADVRVLLCTAGEASHPASLTTTPERLAAQRLEEFGGGLASLLNERKWQYLGLPDGGLADNRDQLRYALQAEIGVVAAAGGLLPEQIVVVAPYRHDGHTDHDALGSVAAEVSAAGGYGLLEYPIWYWLWAEPTDPAWRSWRRFPLGPADRQAKAAAMAAHTSQVEPLSELPGDEVLLPPAFLAHFERSWETFAWHPAASPAAAAAASVPAAGLGGDGGSRRGAPDDGASRRYTAGDAERIFDAVHRGDEDPWEYTTSWYEQRKRALTLAALPDEHYAAGLEIGCSIGTLSLELAQRCDSFLAVDASSAALAQATIRLAQVPAARTSHLTVPHEWPDGQFDLIVISEVGYYLSPDELAGLLERVEAALLPGGTLALCHWRHPVSGWELDGDAVHAAARRQLGWAGAGLYREDDFVLEVLLAPDAGSLSAAPSPAPARGR